MYLFYKDHEVFPTGKWAIKREFHTWVQPRKNWRSPIIYDGEHRAILMLEVRNESYDFNWVTEHELSIVPGGNCET